MTSHCRKHHFSFPPPYASTPGCSSKITDLNVSPGTQCISDLPPLAPLYVPHLCVCVVFTDLFEISSQEWFCAAYLTRSPVVRPMPFPYTLCSAAEFTCLWHKSAHSRILSPPRFISANPWSQARLVSCGKQCVLQLKQKSHPDHKIPWLYLGEGLQNA